MFKRLLFFLLGFVALSGLNAQSPKNRVITIPVTRNGILLREPWVGGMNAPQFSTGDLNNDGIDDLMVFDRYGNKVLTYLSNGDGTDSMFRYAPQFEALFPADLEQFALLRDYNKDRIPDIFTFSNAYAGVRVFKGSIRAGLLHFDLVCPVIQYTDSPYTTVAFVNNADIPAFADVNRDGYLDMLSYDIFGSSVAYYKNLTNLYPGDPAYDIDSFRFTQVTSCWGNFSQNIGSNSMSMNVTCKGGSGQTGTPPGLPRHAGNSIYNFEDPTYHTVDILNGNIGYNNLFYVQNCGDSSYANACVLDSLWPSCDVPMTIPSYPAAYGVDVNNDGLEDLLISPNQTTEELDVNNVLYYKNTGNPSCPYNLITDSFLVHNMLDFGTDSKGLFYDFDGDGLKDIVVGNYGYFQSAAPYISKLAYYRNTGTATQPAFTYQTDNIGGLSQYGLQGIDPAFGDMNGDGKPDMIVGDITGGLSYFQNSSTTGGSVFSSMTASQYFNLNVGANAAPFIYDLNGDSLPDLLVGRQDGGISYFWNFGTKTAPQFSMDSMNLYIGNINVTVSPNSVGYSQPYVFDSAGHLKLLVGSLSGKVFEFDVNTNNLRQGEFNLITSDFLQQPVGTKSTISVADINNDGELEYLVGNGSGGLEIFSDSAWNPGTSLGIAEIEKGPAQLRIYPNPAKDYFTCSVENVELVNPKVEVFNVLGEKLNVEANFLSPRLTVNSANLSNGFYIVKILDAGKAYLGKVLLQR